MQYWKIGDIKFISNKTINCSYTTPISGDYERNYQMQQECRILHRPLLSSVSPVMLEPRLL